MPISTGLTIIQYQQYAVYSESSGDIQVHDIGKVVKRVGFGIRIETKEGKSFR